VANIHSAVLADFTATAGRVCGFSTRAVSFNFNFDLISIISFYMDFLNRPEVFLH